MNTPKKILPNILVVSSILCLLVFLILWNIRQYEQAEGSYQKELSFHLESATNEVHQKEVNSFIKKLKFNVNPTKEDDFFNGLKKEGDSMPRVVVWIDSLQTNTEDKKEFKLRSIPQKIDSSLTGIRYKAATKNYFPEIKGDSTKNTSLDGGDFFAFLRSDKTTKELEKTLELFKKKLREDGLPGNFVMEKDSIVSESSFLAIEYEAPSSLLEKRVIYFYDYQLYLFTQITHSILFSVFLFVLVLLAFWVVLRSLRSQRKLVDLKNDFISNMTHELKTPISTVSVAIEAIRRYDVIKDKEKTEEYLEISSNELGRLSLLVEKVLRTTLFESGKGFLNPQPIDLTSIVKDTLKTMKMHFEERQVMLLTQLSEKPLWVMGDKVHLTNVVYNLIENAIKYSKEEIQISVSTQQLAGNVLFTVSDNGIGIPAEHQKHIFTKFYRVPNHDRHNVKGHGLGLSYVKQVVDELGGSIELKSQLGKGSSFLVHLKAAHHE